MKYIIEESKFKTAVKTIFESYNLNDYKDEDFIEVFMLYFRPWVKLNHGDEISQYPMSYLFQSYFDDFVKDMGLGYVRSYGNIGNRMSDVGKELVRQEKHTLPSLGKQDKFTEKYAEGIQRIIKFMDLPDYFTVNFEEPRPYYVSMSLMVDFEKYIKDNSITTDKIHKFGQFPSKFKQFLENFMGITFGLPSHGHLTLQVISEPQMIGEEEWIKKVFNKTLKKELKTLPNSSIVHSIKYERNTYMCHLKISRKSSSYWNQGSKFREEAVHKLEEMGYNTSIFRVDI